MSVIRGVDITSDISRFLVQTRAVNLLVFVLQLGESGVAIKNPNQPNYVMVCNCCNTELNIVMGQAKSLRRDELCNCIAEAVVEHVNVKHLLN